MNIIVATSRSALFEGGGTLCGGRGSGGGCGGSAAGGGWGREGGGNFGSWRNLKRVAGER